MERITEKDLAGLVERINRDTKSPETSYTRGSNGKLTANIGNYHLDYAYGGVKLHRMCNESGGVDTVSTGGFGTKREIYTWMGAFLAGIAV